jgi:hypothetical protein
VIGYLAHGLVRENLGLLIGRLDRVGVVWPAGQHGGISGLLEHLLPDGLSEDGGDIRDGDVACP